MCCKYFCEIANGMKHANGCIGIYLQPSRDDMADTTIVSPILMKIMRVNFDICSCGLFYQSCS